MKKLWVGLSLLALSATASADFFSSNNGEWKMGPYGPYYEENDWPEWTPMYWMEEMMNSFDDEDNGFGNFGGMPFMGGNNYAMPYGGMPYGAPMMAPPLGAMPYGAPMMPPAAPPMMPPMPAMPAAPGGMPGPAAPAAPAN